MVSLNSILTLGVLGGAALLYFKYGGLSGIGSALGSAVSGFGSGVTQGLNRFGNLVETPQSNAPNTTARVVEQEQLGIDFLNNLYGPGSWYKQTSYNKAIRKNFAGVGFTYDEDRDAFITPKPFPSWVLNEDTCLWEAPVVYPDDANRYNWNEETQSWDQVDG